MDELAGGLETSIISTLLTIGISGKIPSLLDLGIKISINEISDTLRSIIPGRRKNEPRYNITIEKEYVIITVDIPGIPRKNIYTDPREKSVGVIAAFGDRLYAVKIPLKVRIDPRSEKIRYCNGVLELRYKRVRPTKYVLRTI
jgi:HSP20 family molecular chaperone IbpA